MAKEIHTYGKKANGKNAVGRPSKLDALYPSADIFHAAIDAYFDKAKREKVVPTLEHLVITLGFYDAAHLRQWLAARGGMAPEFIQAYKSGKYRISGAYTNMLASGMGYGPGLMFLLCNLTRKVDDEEDQYVNPQRVELTGKDGGAIRWEADLDTALEKVYGKQKK